MNNGKGAYPSELMSAHLMLLVLEERIYTFQRLKKNIYINKVFLLALVMSLPSQYGSLVRARNSNLKKPFRKLLIYFQFYHIMKTANIWSPKIYI